MTLTEAMDAHIDRTLAECGGNISAAARRLGIQRSTLQRRLRRRAPRSAPGYTGKMSIEVTQAEIVTVRLVCNDGSAPIEVTFTRDEYAQMEFHAARAGKTIERWILDTTLERAKNPANPRIADRRGLS